MPAFALLPASYADPSWWNPDWLPVALFERLRANPRGCRRLSAFLLRRTGLPAACALRGDAAETRIALAAPEELGRGVFLAGLTLLSPAVARILRGADRAAAKAAIGARDYDFAIRRGRLLLQQARLAGEAGEAGVADLAGLDGACRSVGAGALATALGEAPEAVVRRTQLKLPKALVDDAWRPLGGRSGPYLRLFELLRAQAGPA